MNSAIEIVRNYDTKYEKRRLANKLELRLLKEEGCNY